MKYFFYEKEIKSLLTSSVDKRIRYFIHKVADWEYFYLPYDKQRGLDTVYDDAGQKGVCVWPFKEFADVYYKDNLIMQERVKKMSIYKFLKEYVDDLAQLNTNIFVFLHYTPFYCKMQQIFYNFQKNVAKSIDKA